MNPPASPAAFVAALQRQDRVGVRQNAAGMLDAGARLAGQWKAVAQVMLNDGEYELARRAADALARQVPGPGSEFERAATYARSGRPQVADEILQALPETVPDRLNHHYTRATLRMNLGDLPAARSHFQQALTLDPTSGEAWLGLAMAGGLDAEWSEKLLAAKQTANGPPTMSAAALQTALGRVHEKQGDHAEAFARYAASGAVLESLRPYDRAADLAEARRNLSIETLGTPAAGDARGPIFVTGLPRSGTTLVEQILASHDLVSGGGELELLPQVARLVGGPGVDAIARYSGPETPAGFYSRLAAERFGNGRLVDKSLSTSRYVAQAAAMFPQARFVWLRRDMHDCAWSAFRSFFLTGVSWSQSLEGLGAHFAMEDALFEHWRGLLGDRLLVTEFTELVEDSAAMIAAIAAHCGLDLQDAMLAPHKTERAVITNSAAQVREPINKRGLGSSAPYHEMLAPVFEAYDRARAQLD
ncbi:tetratricopeptide repeat-containing sulfotransferase family protein [Paraurantiacibacter namhicola]|uniref:Tetratricopeptide repeat protein n=1 Tax=Paraurantiacibacter namhicola TaxID=645517 RepID=A0A1C7D632_9SPHN|nr:sulfotransferase [Paraurantiacibacter namhicola]ANU06812.1 Tetratricopeptide repeat protein [Paraurantiacibacter namhicola]